MTSCVAAHLLWHYVMLPLSLTAGAMQVRLLSFIQPSDRPRYWAAIKQLRLPGARALIAPNQRWEFCLMLVLAGLSVAIWIYGASFGERRDLRRLPGDPCGYQTYHWS